MPVRGSNFQLNYLITNKPPIPQACSHLANMLVNSELHITDDLYTDPVKILPDYINKWILWCLVCSVNSSDYNRKTSSCYKMCFYVGLYNCSVYGNLIYLAAIFIIPSHTAGMAQLSVDRLSPNCLAKQSLGTPVWSLHRRLQTKLYHNVLWWLLLKSVTSILHFSSYKCYML